MSRTEKDVYVLGVIQCFFNPRYIVDHICYCVCYVVDCITDCMNTNHMICERCTALFYENLVRVDAGRPVNSVSEKKYKTNIFKKKVLDNNKTHSLIKRTLPGPLSTEVELSAENCVPAVPVCLTCKHGDETLIPGNT